MSGLPTFALSIRQPWAWAILHAGKDVENRDWYTARRGPICIHAAKSMTKAEFDGFVDLARVLYRARDWPEDLWVPNPANLKRGGIVGTAEIVDCVRESASPWFAGKWGFVVRNVQPVEFIPCKGALGFFAWTGSNAAGRPAAVDQSPSTTSTLGETNGLWIRD